MFQNRRPISPSSAKRKWKIFSSMATNRPINFTYNVRRLKAVDVSLAKRNIVWGSWSDWLVHLWRTSIQNEMLIKAVWSYLVVREKKTFGTHPLTHLHAEKFRYACHSRNCVLFPAYSLQLFVRLNYFIKYKANLRKSERCHFIVKASPSFSIIVKSKHFLDLKKGLDSSF